MERIERLGFRLLEAGSGEIVLAAACCKECSGSAETYGAHR